MQSPREYFEIYTEKKISKITALHSVPTGLTTKKRGACIALAGTIIVMPNSNSGAV